MAFTPFTFAALACLCSIKWRLQIHLVISLVSAVSQPAVSARDTLLLSLAHIKLKHLPRPLFGINRLRPNDQIWPFIDCTGIAQPNRDVAKSHVCKRWRQVRKLMPALSKCVLVSIIPNSFQSVRPRSPSAVLFFFNNENWMNGSHETRTNLFPRPQWRLLEKAGALFRK